MMLVDKETGKGYVEMEKVHHDKKEYASKGVAGTALGLGIAGTALALFNNGFGGNLFGCRGAAADGAVAAASIANERYLERKQCADHVQFVNDMWRTSYNQQNQRFEDRQTINQEMFGIYSAMRNGFDIINATANKNAFDLYKYSRDNKDELAGQIGELKTEENGLIDIETLLGKSIDNLIVSPVQEYPDMFKGVTIGNGKIRIGLPGINKDIVLDANDIETFKQSLVK